MMSHNIPFGYFLLSFNDYIGGVIDSLSMDYFLDILLSNH